MRQLIVALLAPAAIFTAVGCAILSSGDVRTMTYTTTVGPATPYDIMRKTRLWLNRHQFGIRRIDSTAYDLRIETEWRWRYALQDEIDRGIVEARTRLRLNARARVRAASGSSDLRILRISAENMVRMADSLNWTRGFVTPMFKKYIDEIVDGLKTELQTGVRVF